MTEQTSRLAIVIDSTGAEKQADNLSTALDKMTGSGKEATKAVSDTGKAAESAAKSVTKKAKATEDESNALTDLLAKIRPTNTALAELDKLSRQLSSAFNKGFINENQFVTYATILDGIVMKTEKLDDELTGAAAAQRESAKATQEATAQAEAQARSLSQLEARLSPVTAALKSLDDQQRQVADFAKSGAISSTQYDTYIAKIEATRREVTGEAQAERDAAKAKQEHIIALGRLEASLDPVTSALKRLDAQQKQVDANFKSGDLNQSQYTAYSQAISKAKAEVNGEAQAARESAKAHEEQRASLQRLVAQLDPVTTAFKRLDQQQEQLNSAKAAGMLSPDMYDTLSGKLGQVRSDLERANAQLGKVGMSAKQTAQALRQVPMQFTDIFTSLAAGQPPLQVFLQQGGQLKDTFGGIAPAAKALGGYVIGLVTPFTLAAAAVGALGVAYYQGSQEQDAFNQSLILTGNVVGKTSGQLMDLSRNIAQSTGATVGASAEVLNRVVSAGKIASGSLQTVSEAAVNMNKATGIAVDQLVGDFEKIAGGPTEAIGKLNDQYHFLSLATYNQIRALEEQGNKEAAAKLATEEYANTINSRAEQVKASLGTLESAWNATGRAAKWAWDSMLDVGRADTLDEKIAKARENVATRGTRTFSKYGNSDPRVELNLLMMQKQIQGDLNSALAEEQKFNEKAIKTRQEADQANAQYMSNSERRIKLIQKQDEFLKAGAISADQYAKNVSRINDMYKDPKEPKSPKGKAYTEDAATRLLDQIGQQTAAMQSQIGISDKLSAATQQRIKFEQQIADLKGKDQLTADQKSVLSRSGEILQAYKAQEALSNQVKTLDDYRKMQDAVLTKDERTNDLLKERLDLLEKAKATGKLQPGEYEKTRANIYQNTTTPLPSSVQSAVGNMTPSGGQLSGTFGGMQQQFGQLDKAQQDLDAWLAAKEAAYAKATQITAEGEAAISRARADAAAANQAIEMQKDALITAATQSMMDSGLSILKDGFGEQSGVYKVAFAASKAFAIAQSLVAIQQGIAMAAANPFPANLLAMASVAAQTASIVANISSVAGSGFMTGGYTGNMATNAVAGVVHGKEFVLNAAATKAIGVPSLNALNNGKPLDATLGRSGFGTGAQNVSNSSQKTVNYFTANLPPVTVNGNPSDATIQLVQQAAKTGAEEGYRKVVNDMASGKGDAHKALVGGYNTSRRTG